MGWNTSALFIEGRSVEHALEVLPEVFGFRDTGERVNAEEAWAGSPGDRVYLADSGGWCQIWDPDQRFAPRLDKMIEMGAGRELAGTRALAVLFSSVTSTYGFWLYDDCRLVRHAMFESGTPITETGEPLAVEAEVALPSWGHDEAFVWAVIESVTGLAGDVDQDLAVYAVV